jgi:hypothetical protein
MRCIPAVIYFLFFFPLFCSAQELNVSSKSISIKVSGTSTLHSWEMLSAQGECRARVITGSTGRPEHVSQLNFNTPVMALHSTHPAMDKSALGALRSDRFPMISWTMGEAVVASDGVVTGKGILTIAGVSRPEAMAGVIRGSANDGFMMTGTKKIHLRDFSVVPPAALFGLVKSGEDIVLEYSIILIRQ